MMQSNDFWTVAWRVILIAWGLLLLALTVGFALQAPWAIALWPWPDGRLSYLFVASILAAVALPIIWIGGSGELAAQRAGALDFLLSFAGIAATLGSLYMVGRTELYIFTLAALAAAVANLLVYLTSRRTAFRDRRPTPALVYFSFTLFALLLTLVGGGLLLQLPVIFPWPLKPETSVLFGWIYLGAAVYFLHGVYNPYWANAKGQLLGFLAYDAVLLWPFYQHFSTVPIAHWLSLAVYFGVLVYSALLALYFLFLHPSTRFGRS